MNTILLPLAALLIAILLMIIYFSKRNMNNKETKIYSKMLVVNLIYAVLAVITFIYSKTIGEYIVIAFMQKIYMISMVALTVLIVLYNTVIAGFSKKLIKTINIGMIVTFTIFSILILATKLHVINYGDIIDGNGLSYEITLIATVFYLIIIVISTIYIFLKNKKMFSKDIPFIVLIVFYIVGIIIRNYFPHVMFENFFFSFMLMIMYFTIENPDLQMLNEFHKAREYADNLNKEKSEFLFNMAGQIKEPIKSINKISKNILMEDDISIIKEYATKIKYSSNDLLELVNKVLDINSLEKRKVSIRESKYSVKNLFKEIESQTRLKLVNDKIDFRIKYDKSIPTSLYGDAVRIRQILTTLLENAIKYTKSGFIELEVNSIIKHDVCRLIITVEDSGIGMIQDKVQHLFDKNEEQINKVDTSKMGLGLVKTMLDLIDGTILVNSELDRGTKFTIILDQTIANTKKSKTIEVLENYENTYLNNKKIVFVINDEKISKKVENLFKKYSVDIDIVALGQNCLEKVRDGEQIDLIIMEDNLPKLSSENTLVKLKSIKGFKIPVILLTELKDINEKEEYLKLGFSEVVTLPLTKEKTNEIIHDYKLIKDN